MAELADALDLGSSGQPPCRFDSCYPHESIEKCIAGCGQLTRVYSQADASQPACIRR